MNRPTTANRVNDQFALAIVVIVGASPIPFGSNMPVFWATWCLVITSLLIVYLVVARRKHQPLRVSVSALGGEITLFTLYGVALAFQLLPLKLMFDIDCKMDHCGAAGQLSMTPGDTWFALMRWVTYGMLFYIAVQVSVREKRAERLALLVVAITTSLAVYGLFALTTLGDTILFMEKIYYHGFATGPFVNRNSFATFLGIGLVVALSMLLSGGTDSVGHHQFSRNTTLFLAAASFVLLITIVATQSRMGLFSTLIASFTVIALKFPPGRAARWALVFGGTVVVVILGVYGRGLLDRALVVVRSADDRFELYRQILTMILERPFTGYGAGSFRLVFPQFHQSSLDVGVTWDYAHSTYLALWSGTGVVIGTLPLIAVGLINLSILRNARSHKKISAVSAAAVGATVLASLHSLVDFSLEIQGVAILYTFVMAVGSARSLSSRVRVP